MSKMTSSRLMILLVVSVVINALLVGFILGGGLAKNRHGGHGAEGGDRALVHLIERNVSSEERGAVREALRAAFIDTRQQRLAIRESRAELSELIQDEPYDAAAVGEVLSRIRAAETQMAARLHEELNAQMGELSQEQRQAIMDAMARHRRRGPMGLRPGDNTRRPPNQ